MIRKMTLATLVLAATAAMAGAPAMADDDDDEAAEATSAGGAIPGTRTLELGFAGLMDNRNRTDLEPITLTVGQLQSPGEYQLQSGGYYRLEITSDGTQELAVEGPGFFRNVWVNEIVINDIEVRPLGVESLEFDSAGTARISFVAIVPGQYELRIPGTTGETQRATFVIQ